MAGPIAPVFSVFDAQGRFDGAGQAQFLSFLETFPSIRAYFVRSGLGRMYTFDMADAKAIVACACRHFEGRKPVLAGCSGVWDRDRDRLPAPSEYLAQALELSRYAEAQGAAAVVHVMPEALKRSGVSPEDATLRYFETVSAAVDLPVVIYQPPGTDPAFRLTPGLLVRLCDAAQVAGAKVSSTDAALILDLSWAVRERDFAYIVGAETAYYAGLPAGACGVIGQGSCMYPWLLERMAAAYDDGETGTVRELQARVNGLVRECTAPAEFLKRYAKGQGFALEPFERRDNGAPALTLSGETYQRYLAYYREHALALR
jgi:dihydrodipicolinate synthase/N-acetylneuraminate lyase